MEGMPLATAADSLALERAIDEATHAISNP